MFFFPREEAECRPEQAAGIGGASRSLTYGHRVHQLPTTSTHSLNPGMGGNSAVSSQGSHHHKGTFPRAQERAGFQAWHGVDDRVEAEMENLESEADGGLEDEVCPPG